MYALQEDSVISAHSSLLPVSLVPLILQRKELLKQIVLHVLQVNIVQERLFHQPNLVQLDTTVLLDHQFLLQLLQIKDTILVQLHPIKLHVRQEHITRLLVRVLE